MHLPKPNAAIGDLSQWRNAIMDEHHLSKREKEVVGLILEGHTRASAAEMLFISQRTVKFHLENAYRKMGVHGKGDLAKRLANPKLYSHAIEQENDSAADR